MYKSQDLAEPAISALIRDEFLRGDWADEMGVAIILLGEERNMKGLSTAVPAPVMIRSHSVITEGTSDFYFLIFLSSAAVSTHDLTVGIRALPEVRRHCFILCTFN